MPDDKDDRIYTGSGYSPIADQSAAESADRLEDVAERVERAVERLEEVEDRQEREAQSD